MQGTILSEGTGSVILHRKTGDKLDFVLEFPFIIDKLSSAIRGNYSRFFFNDGFLLEYMILDSADENKTYVRIFGFDENYADIHSKKTKIFKYYMYETHKYYTTWVRNMRVFAFSLPSDSTQINMGKARFHKGFPDVILEYPHEPDSEVEEQKPEQSGVLGAVLFLRISLMMHCLLH